MYKQVVAPQIGVFGGRHLGGVDFSPGWSYFTEPFLMAVGAHKHDFDHIILFSGGDPNNIGDFAGEVEMYLGENGVTGQSTLSIDYPLRPYRWLCPSNMPSAARAS